MSDVLRAIADPKIEYALRLLLVDESVTAPLRSKVVESIDRYCVALAMRATRLAAVESR